MGGKELPISDELCPNIHNQAPPPTPPGHGGDGPMVTPPELRDLAFHLTWVKKAEYWGAINPEGLLVINPEWETKPVPQHNGSLTVRKNGLDEPDSMKESWFGRLGCGYPEGYERKKPNQLRYHVGSAKS